MGHFANVVRDCLIRSWTERRDESRISVHAAACPSSDSAKVLQKLLDVAELILPSDDSVSPESTSSNTERSTSSGARQ
jgi:hypothetical protein